MGFQRTYECAAACFSASFRDSFATPSPSAVPAPRVLRMPGGRPGAAPRVSVRQRQFLVAGCDGGSVGDLEIHPHETMVR